jgi:hypothetical protein
MKQMIRRLATTALIALVVFAGVQLAAAALPVASVYLPFVRGAPIRVTGSVFPPAGTSCLLQTGASMVVDPRTDEQVYSCESRDDFGAIVWSGQTLLLSHVATGSGSLSVIDGAVYITAVNDDGSLQIEKVPTP